MRHSASGGGALASGGVPPLPAGAATEATLLTIKQGRLKVALSRVDYSVTPITTGAYVTLIASTTDIINQLHIFSGSNRTLVLAVGAAAAEVNQIYIPPGGLGTPIDLLIPAGSRVSVKAVDVQPVTGALLISYLK